MSEVSTEPRPAGRVEEERKRLILDAAAACVVEDGVDLLPLRKVAKRVRVSIGMITYYFATKNELMIATLRRTEERITAQRRLEVGPNPAIEGVERALEISLTQPETANWPFRLAYAAKAAHEPELQTYHAERIEGLRRGMIHAIERSVESGKIRRDLDAGILADMLLCVYQGLGTEVTLDSEHMPPERAVQILEAFLSFWYTDAGRKPG